jgi:hypothetical protein
VLGSKTDFGLGNIETVSRNEAGFGAALANAGPQRKAGMKAYGG